MSKSFQYYIFVYFIRNFKKLFARLWDPHTCGKRLGAQPSAVEKPGRGAEIFLRPASGFVLVFLPGPSRLGLVIPYLTYPSLSKVQLSPPTW